jgi:hypothetical protein
MVRAQEPSYTAEETTRSPAAQEVGGDSSNAQSNTKAMAAVAAHLSCAFFFFDAEPLGEPGRHALDACALCSKPLTRNSDIFMYRGDTPFCSEDCCDEKMQFDAIRTRQAARSSSAGRQQPYSSSGTESRRGHQGTRKVSAVALTLFFRS